MLQFASLEQMKRGLAVVRPSLSPVLPLTGAFQLLLWAHYVLSG